REKARRQDWEGGVLVAAWTNRALEPPSAFDHEAFHRHGRGIVLRGCEVTWSRGREVGGAAQPRNLATALPCFHDRRSARVGKRWERLLLRERRNSHPRRRRIRSARNTKAARANRPRADTPAGGRPHARALRPHA